METTKYTKLYAVTADDSPPSSFDLSSVSVSLALGYDSSCEINVIGARDTGNNSKVVAMQDADSLYMETLMREFRYGRRFHVYQSVSTSNPPDMLLFSGFVFSAGSGVSSSAQSLELGFKVTLASAAKLYDNSYIKNPGYYFVRSSNDSKYGPTRLSTLIPLVAEWKSTPTGNKDNKVPDTVDAILGNQELIKGPTDIVRVYQQLIDFFMQGERNATTSQNPHKIADMFDIDNAYQLNATINTQATVAVTNKPPQQTIHPVLRSIIVGRVIQNLPGNSAVAVFCHALSEFYLTVAPRVSTELEKNMVIIPSSGFGTYTNELTNSDVIGYTRYEAQRAPNSLVNIWVYGNTQSDTTSSNWPLVALKGGYNDEGQLTVDLIDNPLDWAKKNKGVALGPIQTVQMPMWGLQGTGTDAKTGKNTLTEQQKKLAAALATTMFASSGMVADNISMTISYDALEKVINGVGCVYKLDTLLPGGQVGSISARAARTASDRIANSLLNRYVCYGRLKQLSFQFSCNGTNLNTQVQCTFDSVLREPEYQDLVVKGSLKPENMLLIPKNDKAEGTK